MRYFAGVKSRYLGYITLLGGVSILVLSGPSVAAQTDNTVVQALICSDVTGSSISVDSPLSDSIVISPVTVTGTALYTSQIEVSIDGAYDSTISLGMTETEFSFPLSLAEGTHTVRLVANDRCYLQNASVDIVLTYQPVGEPSSGTTTPTKVVQETPSAGTGGIYIGPDVAPVAPTETASGVSGPIAVLIQPLRTLATVLDIDSTLEDGTVQGTARVSLIILGAFMASVGSPVLVSSLQSLRLSARASKVKRYFASHRVFRESAFRLSGAALFVLAFMI